MRATAVLVALAVDLGFGDPSNRLHPVVLMGRWLSWGQRLAPHNHRFWFGTGWTMAGLAMFAAPWLILSRKQLAERGQVASRCGGVPLKSSGLPRWSNRPGLLSVLASALLLKPVFAYRNLRARVTEVGQALEIDNLAEARRLAGWHLVSRDTGQLSAEEVAGAAIESLAENITDSFTAPLLAFAVGGLPAVWAYRLVNTADAMWGYRTPEFEQLGKFAARLDDGLNWLPARLTGALLVASAWLTGDSPRRAGAVMLAQRQRTASPNAGWTMGAMAGALEVTLTKRGVYRLEGGNRPVTTHTIRRALRLTDICVALLTIILVLVAAVNPANRKK